MLTDVEFDAFEVWVGQCYAEKGVPPTSEEVRRCDASQPARPSSRRAPPPAQLALSNLPAACVWFCSCYLPLQAKEFGLVLSVTDHNPPIDPRLPRFDRVRDSLGKAIPF